VTLLEEEDDRTGLTPTWSRTPPVGHWSVQPHWRVATQARPNWIRRFFCWALLGWTWIPNE